MSQVTSTKPSQKGTFGEEKKLCVFDGSTMRKLEHNVMAIEGFEQYYCPLCGWVANFLKKET